MSQPKIVPDKVTKPIQLLAAWLAGLIIIDSTFLLTASKNGLEHWTSSALIIAAIVNVPIFLASIFLLQTRFRPEMQEDEYYAKYLETRFSNDTGKNEELWTGEDLNEIKASIEELKLHKVANKNENRSFALAKTNMQISGFSPSVRGVQVNDLLPKFSKIFKAFEACGVKVESTFGSTSKEPKVPSKFAISIGDDFDLDVFRKVLPIAYENGAEIINFVSQPLAYGQIYVGSYGYEAQNRVNHSLDDELVLKLTQEAKSLDDIKRLLM
ncbi:TPA: hypothetical protein ACQJOT_004489 [Vibrio parahaemolyticus]